MESTIDKLIGRTEALERANKKLKDQLRHQSSQAQQTTSAWQKGVDRLILTYLGTNGLLFAIRQVNQALERQVDLDLLANQKQVTIGEAKQELVASMPGTSRKQMDDFLLRMTKLMESREVTLFEPQHLVTIGRQALTGSVGDNKQRITDTINILRNIDTLRGSPEQAPMTAKTVIALASTLGLDEAPNDKIRKQIIDTTMGMVAPMISQSFISGPEGLEGALKMIATGQGTATDDDEPGLSFEEKFKRRARVFRNQFALFAAVTTRAAEAGGMESSTLGANLMSGLAELLPAKDIKDKFGKIKKRALVDAEGNPFTTNMARLAAIEGAGAFTPDGRFISAETLQRDFEISARGDVAEERGRARSKIFSRDITHGGLTANIAKALFNNPEAFPELALGEGADDVLVEQKGRARGELLDDPDIKATAEDQAFGARNTRNLVKFRSGAGRAAKRLFGEKGISTTTGGSFVFGPGARKKMFGFMTRVLGFSADETELAMTEALLQASGEGNDLQKVLMQNYLGMHRMFGGMAPEDVEMWKQHREALYELHGISKKTDRTVTSAAAGAANATRGRTEAR